jgi:rhomboid protease GluP
MKTKLTTTNIVILLTVVAYLLQSIITNADLIFGLNHYFFLKSYYFQLFTTIFIHAGIAHLLMNMIALVQLGNLVERIKGIKLFLIIYFGGGFLTSISTAWFIYAFKLNHNVVGASGAICVLAGYIAKKDTRLRNNIFITIALITFVPFIFSMPIAWYSHLFGFIIGWIFGYKK